MNTSDYIMFTIVAIFLLAVIIGGISYESMTPEEKKKFEEEQRRKKEISRLTKDLRRSRFYEEWCKYDPYGGVFSRPRPKG